MESTTPLPELLASTHLGNLSVSNLYSALDVSKKEVRVLRLSSIPTENDDSIQCTLSTISLEDNLDFIPLSYVWGDASKTTEIFVDGISFQATLNLVDFFRHYKFLPEKYQNTALWVDAICINQHDLEERGQQVALMAEIYGGPPLTISWLGPQSIEEKSDLGVEWIIKISKDIEEADDAESLDWLERYARDLLTGSTPSLVWSSIGSLLARPYWTRVWTRQECVLPNENIFLCGSGHFYYSQLALFAGAIDYACNDGSSKLIATIATAPKDEHYTRQLLTFREFQDSTLNFLSIWSIKSFKSLQGGGMDFWSKIMGKNEDIQIQVAKAWLATYGMTQLNVTDPRDFVYGAGGMFPCPVIGIDYNKAVRDLFIEHAALPVRCGCSFQKTSYMTLVLGITGFVGGEKVEELPSWVPNWGNTRSVFSVHYKVDADASGQRGTNWEESTMPVVEGPILRAFGVKVSEIKFVQWGDGLTLLGFMTKTFLDFYDGEWAPIDKFQEGLKVFLRISYEVETDEDDALWVYTCALLVYFVEEDILSLNEDVENQVVQTGLQQNHSLNTDQKAKRMDFILSTFGLYTHGNNPHNFWDHLFPDGLMSPLSTEQFEVIVAQAQKKLLKIQLLEKERKKCAGINFRTENGCVGTTLGEIRPGDMLCVLFGCALPVILRKVEEHYLHLGLCFAVHLMNGEAVKNGHSAVGELEIVRFDIH